MEREVRRLEPPPPADDSACMDLPRVDEAEPDSSEECGEASGQQVHHRRRCTPARPVESAG